MPLLRQKLLTLVVLFVLTLGALESVFYLSGFTSSLPLLASPLSYLGLTMVAMAMVLVKNPHLLQAAASFPRRGAPS